MNEGAIHKAIRKAARDNRIALQRHDKATADGLRDIKYILEIIDQGEGHRNANAEHASQLTLTALQAHALAVAALAQEVRSIRLKVDSINKQTTFDIVMTTIKTVGIIAIVGVAAIEGMLLLRRQYTYPVIQDQFNQVALVCQRDPQSGFTMQFKGPGARPITVYCKTS